LSNLNCVLDTENATTLFSNTQGHCYIGSYSKVYECIRHPSGIGDVVYLLVLRTRLLYINKSMHVGSRSGPDADYYLMIYQKQ